VDREKRLGGCRGNCQREAECEQRKKEKLLTGALLLLWRDWSLGKSKFRSLRKLKHHEKSLGLPGNAINKSLSSVRGKGDEVSNPKERK